MTQLAKEAAKSWSSTLRLPKSTFPARPLQVDLASYVRRCTDDLYGWQTKSRPAESTFVLHDGPPYANGQLHVGHALNKILKDIICRTKLSQGNRVQYIPGWDCHGLPIELKALERHGWKTQQTENAALPVRQAARGFAADAVQQQMQGFRSWGIMADWSNHWKTMDTDFELRQLAVFRAMAAKGLIYRRHKPVYWSPSSQTALAEAELEYKDDHVSTAAVVKFPLQTLPQDGGCETTYACIWTTTPWTLPANQAIAFSKNLEYLRVRSEKHGLLVFARARLPYMQEMLEETLEVVDDHISVEGLASTTYGGPTSLDKYSVRRPMFHADFVSAETGTGLVHCAPGHGMEDYEALQPLIQQQQVEVKAPVDDQGCFTNEAAPSSPGSLTGKHVFQEGNEAVLEMLKSECLLLTKHQYKHKYPYDWRTKGPVMIRATAQWFTDISGIKSDTLLAMQEVQFRPQTGQARLRSFIENRNEWCISRQRAWGVPIPAIYDKATGEAILNDESIRHIIEVIGKRGIDAWWADAADDPVWIMPSLNATSYRRGTDTMDVWFDSGTSWTHMTTTGSSQNGPLADVYLEGTDQHRGWFQSSLLTYIAYQKSANPNGKISAPFKQLITHGFTLDVEGKKMSKSIGNVVSPDEIITGNLLQTGTAAIQPQKTTKKQRQPLPLGPDALRLWAASSDWTKDVIVSETIIKTVHAALHKYRVTLKLLLGALQDFEPAHLVDHQKLSLVDRIALLQLSQVSNTARLAFQEFEFYKAVTAINRWVNADFSGFYMEAAKDSLYCDSEHSLRRKSVQTVLYHVLFQLQSMLGPLTPILIEESWAHCPPPIKEQTEHPLQRVWEALPPEWNDEELARDVVPVVMAINAATKIAQEKARSDKKMGSSLESDVLLMMDLDSLRAGSYASCEEFLGDQSAQNLQELMVVSKYTMLPTTVFKNSQVLRDCMDEVCNGFCKDEFVARYMNDNIDVEYQQDNLRHPLDIHQAQRTLATTTWENIWDKLRTHKGKWAYVEDVTLPNGQKLGSVVVHSPTHCKCSRCWRYSAPNPTEDEDADKAGAEPPASSTSGETGRGTQHDLLCARCEKVVAERSGW